VGFGTEILFMIALGGLLLGPKRLHAVLGNVARAKAQFEKASRNLKSQLEAELEARHGNNKTDSSQELAGEQ
jgi:Sec-independent protein translocase protein TatA